MKNNKKLVLTGIVIISIFGVLALTFFKNTKVADSRISATVTNIVDRANVAEDGYYEITVTDKVGKQYKIDATGYLNTPAPPDQFGEACVHVPKVQKGDKVSFNLPKSESQNGYYVSCYKQNLRGYYFTVE